MNKYKICKFVDGNNKEWYQVKRKWWIFWHWAYRTEFIGGEFVCANFLRKFDTFEDAKDWIEKSKKWTIAHRNSKKQKIVDCVEI